MTEVAQADPEQGRASLEQVCARGLAVLPAVLDRGSEGSDQHLDDAVDARLR